ncbi:Heat shock protein 90-1 [Acorus gramineus]|uniref:Heat shock protein 90-1 n=1 Tax=Acorus gramineus TaxID=55184 RepID=A0AAV9B7I3_ACOGR|nr:Heat shock protein 90-1 [Acorus gramineus]
MFKELCKTMKDILGGKVEKVVVSERLVDSSSCIVAGLCPSSKKKIMEINMENRIMVELRRAQVNQNSASMTDLVFLLFETAMLMSGFSLDEPNMLPRRIHRILELGLSMDAGDGASGDGGEEMPELEEVK